MVDATITSPSEAPANQQYQFSVTLTALISKDLITGITLTGNHFTVSAQAALATGLLKRGNRLDP